jgi:hypothetical protein
MMLIQWDIDKKEAEMSDYLPEKSRVVRKLVLICRSSNKRERY